MPRKISRRSVLRAGAALAAVSGLASTASATEEELIIESDVGGSYEVELRNYLDPSVSGTDKNEDDDYVEFRDDGETIAIGGNVAAGTIDKWLVDLSNGELCPIESECKNVVIRFDGETIWDGKDGHCTA